jgi:ATP:ADP antiporter, AAA family
MMTAMLCAGAVTAQFVGGKATRDALFLASLNYTALPAMVMATSVVSILLVAANSRASRRIQPAILVPVCFAASGVLFLVEWALTERAKGLAAVLVYLHISGIGPLLGSGFWLISSERFDPRTAKRRFGQIAAAGTLGGLLSALLAERVAALVGAAAMLPVLAAFHFISAWQVRVLAVESDGAPSAASLETFRNPTTAPSRSGLRVIAEAPYLRYLALLVLLGTTGAALLDYLFKVRAVETFGRGDNLLRFFAVYYAATSLVTFVIQMSSSRFMLERFGLALTASTPSLALFSGGFFGLLSPSFGAIAFARGAESVFRGSLFRAGYELFYTPIAAAEKRAAKSIIDVAFDRLGDAVGGGMVRGVLLLGSSIQSTVIVTLAMACSAAAMLAASRLNRGYIATLEKSLLNRAVELDLSDLEDATSRTLMLRTLGVTRSDFGLRVPPQADAPPRPGSLPAAAVLDPDLQAIVQLRSRNVEQVTRVLRSEEGLSAALVPHVIPLLAWHPVAADAVFALRKVAEERVGLLIDALIDPNQDFTVRRRLARVFSVCVSQRAADGLILGLDDLRFEVRFQCGHSLASVVEKNPRVAIDKERIFAVVMREVAVGRPVWQSRRLLDELDVQDEVSFVDEFVRDRAGQSLAHVFTLLSIVLPREPLMISFRSLYTDDQNLQGTALEYLEGVLPGPIRERLWPFLEDRRPVARSTRPREEILADLLRSNHSIMLNLEELRRRVGVEPPRSGGA